MDTQTDPRLGLGGNLPPDPLVVEADERIDTANKWLNDRKEITDAEMADKAAFFISQVAASHKALDDQRLEEGRLFKKTQEEKYSTPLSILTLALEKLKAMRRVWLQKEDARLEAERMAAQKVVDDARRAAEEAQARADKEAAKAKGGDVLRSEIAVQAAQAKIEKAEEAVAAVPERAQIKGTYTTKAVGLREYWSAEITDFSAAFKHYNAKGNPKKNRLALAIKATIDKFADEDAKLLKDTIKAPPGITFKMEKR